MALKLQPLATNSAREQAGWVAPLSSVASVLSLSLWFCWCCVHLQAQVFSNDHTLEGGTQGLSLDPTTAVVAAMVAAIVALLCSVYRAPN